MNPNPLIMVTLAVVILAECVLLIGLVFAIVMIVTQREDKQEQEPERRREWG